MVRLAGRSLYIFSYAAVPINIFHTSELFNTEFCDGNSLEIKENIRKERKTYDLILMLQTVSRSSAGWCSGQGLSFAIERLWVQSQSLPMLLLVEVSCPHIDPSLPCPNLYGVALNRCGYAICCNECLIGPFWGIDTK